MSAAPKKKGNVAHRVWELSEPLAKELGLSLWDVQFVKEGAEWFLRVFIDKDGGVSIDDCVDMTHALSPVLDREDPIPQEYTEVTIQRAGRTIGSASPLTFADHKKPPLESCIAVFGNCL